MSTCSISVSRVDVEAPPANEIVSEEKLNKLMEKECAGRPTKPLKMNPLCLLFGATLGVLVRHPADLAN